MFAGDHTRKCTRPSTRMYATIHADGRRQSMMNLNGNYEKGQSCKGNRYFRLSVEFWLRLLKYLNELVAEGSLRAAVCVREMRSVATNMLIIFAIACSGDTSADGFEYQ